MCVVNSYSLKSYFLHSGRVETYPWSFVARGLRTSDIDWGSLLTRGLDLSALCGFVWARESTSRDNVNSKI